MTSPDLPGIGHKTMALLQAVKALPMQDIDYEIRKLQAVYEWALEKCGVDFTVGDKVRIKEGYAVRQSLRGGGQHGWWIYRECLVPGATAQVRRIDFNAPHRYWFAEIILDREWSVHEPHTRDGGPVRYWRGPAADTPEGMKPSHRADGEHGVFAFDVAWLEKSDPLASDESRSG